MWFMVWASTSISAMGDDGSLRRRSPAAKEPAHARIPSSGMLMRLDTAALRAAAIRIKANPADSSRIYVVARDFYHSRDGGETFERGQRAEVQVARGLSSRVARNPREEPVDSGSLEDALIRACGVRAARMARVQLETMLRH